MHESEFMFKNIFSFDGRIRRTEYGLTAICFMVYYLLILFSVAYLTTKTSGIEPVYLFILMIPAIWIMLAQAVKRSHDIGNSGWYVFIPYYFFILLFVQGQARINKWGNNPKGIGNIDEIDRIGQHLQETNVTLKN
jgi:uncharacterized membrane protein YhaH (DUF805 family)